MVIYRLVKIEEGLGGGSVLYHKYKNKTEEEKLALDEKKQKQLEDKEERKRIQNENVAKKEKAKSDEKKKQEKVSFNYSLQSDSGKSNNAKYSSPIKCFYRLRHQMWNFRLHLMYDVIGRTG